MSTAPLRPAPVPPTSVLGRATALLDAFDGTGPVRTLADLARATGLPRSTAHRLCHELVDLGLLATADGGFCLGPRLHRLAASVPHGIDLAVTARSVLEDLRRICGGTSAHLFILDGVDVVCLESTPSGRGLMRPGRRLPALTTVAGRAVLAFSPPDVVAASAEAVAGTGGTRPTLGRELTGIRASGIALDRTDLAAGELACAAPVFGPGEKVVAAITLAGLAARSLPVCAPAVRMAAVGLSRQLGAAPR